MKISREPIIAPLKPLLPIMLLCILGFYLENVSLVFLYINLDFNEMFALGKIGILSHLQLHPFRRKNDRLYLILILNQEPSSKDIPMSRVAH